MRLPNAMPAAFRSTDQPIHAFAAVLGGVEAQGIFDIFDPKRLACLACCRGKSGYLACVARCVATGQACDGGLDNCTPC